MLFRCLSKSILRLPTDVKLWSMLKTPEANKFRRGFFRVLSQFEFTLS